MRVRLYFDEDASRNALARELRLRGADVITAVEARTIHADDEQQLLWAASHQRAIYSFNRGDFYQIHSLWLRSGRSHWGLVLSRQDLSVGEQMRRLLRLMNALTGEEMRDRVEFLSSWR